MSDEDKVTFWAMGCLLVAALCASLPKWMDRYSFDWVLRWMMATKPDMPDARLNEILDA